MKISRTGAQMVQTNWLYLLCVLSQLLIASAYANEAIADFARRIAAPFLGHSVSIRLAVAFIMQS